MIDCLANFILVKTHNICYQKFFSNDNSNTPLIIIHGGPGFSHYYLEPLHRIANERSVIFYDQLDCGRSDRINDPNNWNIEYFVSELDTLIKHLNYEEVILYGHSWGSLVALEYALTSTKVKKIIFASPFLSYSLWNYTASCYIKALDKVHQNAVYLAVKEQEFTNADFISAFNEYNFRHVYRTRNLPSYALRSAEESNTAIYNYMWGPSEFVINGTLKDYEGADKLKHLSVPVLFTCGKYDEASPHDCKTLSKKIKKSEIVIFKDSAHIPHITESEKYIAALRKFL